MKQYIASSESNKHLYSVTYTTIDGIEDTEEVYADSEEEAYDII